MNERLYQNTSMAVTGMRKISVHAITLSSVCAYWSVNALSRARSAVSRLPVACKFFKMSEC